MFNQKRKNLKAFFLTKKSTITFKKSILQRFHQNILGFGKFFLQVVQQPSPNKYVHEVDMCLDIPLLFTVKPRSKNPCGYIHVNIIAIYGYLYPILNTWITMHEYGYP